MKYIVIIIIIIIVIKLFSSSKNTKKDIVVKEENKENEKIKNKEYIKPPLKLLNKSETKLLLSQEEIMYNSKEIEKTLKVFNIKAKVVQINYGPSIYLYELELNNTIKVKDIFKIEKELAFALGLTSVRLLVPIPGKSTIGIEVPNKNTSIVTLSEMLTNIPNDIKNNLNIPIGKNYFSQYKYLDLEEKGHLLITGMISSGKSTFLNNIILSIIMRNNPSDVKLNLIDFKITEFNIYSNIPHLITPVISEKEKMIMILEKQIYEINHRYNILMESKTKNIKEYNNFVKNQTNESYNKLPIILTIINSYSDIFPDNIYAEELIQKIVEEGKKVGIFLIVSSDNSSTISRNMINNFNFQTNIKFKSNNYEDKMLIGNGDLLYINQKDTERMQGSYVSYEEIKKVTDFLKDNNSQNNTKHQKIDIEKDELINDPLFKKILEFAIEKGQISASIIQREFSIGYNRAVMYIDFLEKSGFITSSKGPKPRDVLVKSKDEIYK